MIEKMSRNSAYCQSNVAKTISEPTSEITNGKIDQMIVSQKRSIAPFSLFVWLTSEPPNLLAWKNIVWLVSLWKQRTYKSCCKAVSNVQTRYRTSRQPITSEQIWLTPYKNISVHRCSAVCSWLCWIMLSNSAIISGPTKIVIDNVMIVKKMVRFRRCLYGFDACQNRPKICLLLILFFKITPFVGKIFFC